MPPFPKQKKGNQEVIENFKKKKKMASKKLRFKQEAWLHVPRLKGINGI